MSKSKRPLILNASKISIKFWQVLSNDTCYLVLLIKYVVKINNVILLLFPLSPSRYIFRVPVSEFVPVNMKVTLLMK